MSKKRYILSYFQEMGYAAMECFVTLEAENKEEAYEIYPDVVRSQGYACTAKGKGDVMSIKKVPGYLMHLSNSEIFEYYNPPEKCHRLRNGKCDQEKPCDSGHLPYGCFQREYDEWYKKYGNLKKQYAETLIKNTLDRLKGWKS